MLHNSKLCMMACSPYLTDDKCRQVSRCPLVDALLHTLCMISHLSPEFTNYVPHIAPAVPSQSKR